MKIKVIIADDHKILAETLAKVLDKEDDFETRTLYERLKENRELKRQEIEEQFRYSKL